MQYNTTNVSFLSVKISSTYLLPNTRCILKIKSLSSNCGKYDYALFFSLKLLILNFCRFETDDGEFRTEQGRVKNVGGENVNEITGEYSWTSPEGELVSFTYTADENGYQAQGSHLPEAPPLHPHIQLGLELIARANRNNRKRA